MNRSSLARAWILPALALASSVQASVPRPAGGLASLQARPLEGVAQYDIWREASSEGESHFTLGLNRLPILQLNAHRFGYVGGPGGPAGAAKWKLGTLTIGTAGGADPFKDAGIPLGDPTGKGSQPWGQFAYAHVTGAAGDGTKLGRPATRPR